MNARYLLTATDASGVATITLNRPEVHNAFDDVLIGELAAELERVGGDDAVRVVVLAAAGKSFSAGADLNWMRKTTEYTEDENRADALRLATLMRRLNELPKPTIAAVQGAAYGGGVGLVAACDIAVAADSATFALSEARLGIIPSVISPYVLEAIGARAARRYFMTAERFGAHEAHRIGLVHEVAEAAKLRDTVDGIVRALLQCGPVAQREAKQVIASVARVPFDDRVMRDTAHRIARLRASDEGREGIRAFLEKRPARWVPADG